MTSNGFQPQELRHTIFYESNRLLNEVMFREEIHS